MSTMMSEDICKIFILCNIWLKSHVSHVTQFIISIKLLNVILLTISLVKVAGIKPWSN